MLGTPNVEDYFVLSSVHDYPLKVTQLEAYMFMLEKLLYEAIPQIKDNDTREYIENRLHSVRECRANLGKPFFVEAKAKLGVPEYTLVFPQDFPTIRIIDTDVTTVKIFLPQDITFFERKKREVEKSLAKLCDKYNPLLLVAIPTIQMELATKNGSAEFSKFFEKTWKGKELPLSILEKIAQKIGKTGLREFEVQAMYEAYRQVLLTEIDLQRSLREKLYKYCSAGNGEITLYPEYVLLKLFECLFTIHSINWIENMMNEFQLPILVIENSFLSVFTPIISKNIALPFQEELQQRENRLLFQYVSSKAVDEHSIPQVVFFFQSLSRFELEQIQFILYFLEKSKRKSLFFPKSEANRIFNENLDFPEELILEWLEGSKSPFVKIRLKNEDYFLTTSMIFEDKFFRIAWQSHRGKHIKIRGTKFEDFVLDVLQKEFPKSMAVKNKYFLAELNGKVKRFEIDRIFVLKDIFFPIECKNLLLIEDTTDLRKLRSRVQELKGYGEYLELKANLLKTNFKQLEEKIPGLSDHKCRQIVPVIISMYPDLLSFHSVPFMTIYEFIRYVSSCEQKGAFVKSCKDFSGITFNFPSFEIS